MIKLEASRVESHAWRGILVSPTIVHNVVHDDRGVLVNSVSSREISTVDPARSRTKYCLRYEPTRENTRDF